MFKKNKKKSFDSYLLLIFTECPSLQWIALNQSWFYHCLLTQSLLNQSLIISLVTFLESVDGRDILWDQCLQQCHEPYQAQCKWWSKFCLSYPWPWSNHILNLALYYYYRVYTRWISEEPLELFSSRKVSEYQGVRSYSYGDLPLLGLFTRM